MYNRDVTITGVICVYESGDVTGSTLSANSAVSEKMGTLLVAHYHMLSAKSTITDIGKTSIRECKSLVYSFEHIFLLHYNVFTRVFFKLCILHIILFLHFMG